MLTSEKIVEKILPVVASIHYLRYHSLIEDSFPLGGGELTFYSYLHSVVFVRCLQTSERIKKKEKRINITFYSKHLKLH